MVGRVPKRVQDAIKQAAKYNEMARSHENVIEVWLEKIGMHEDDGFRDVLIDSVQQTNNPDAAIEMFEIML